jgi:F0F1-type ATP synthase assembly protein I
LVLLVGQDKKLQELFYLGWIPSFVAGLVTAYTSGNGYVNAGLGMLSATVATTVFLIKAFLKFASKDSSKSTFFSREIIAPFLVVLFLGLSQYHLFSFSNMVYRDADIPQLSSQIESGPFRGLYTTQNKKNYLDELSKDLKAVSRSGDRVLFYYSNFPAGYLLTSMRSAINTTFLVDYEQYNSEAGQFIENYVHEQIKKYRVIAVKIQRVLLRDYSIGKLSDADFISQIVEKSKASEIVAKENYSISVIDRNES